MRQKRIPGSLLAGILALGVVVLVPQPAAPQEVIAATAGESTEPRDLLPGEASRYIPQPEDLCPPGSTRVRKKVYDNDRRLWSICETVDDEGRRIKVGSQVTWDSEHSPKGGLRYLLRSMMDLENGVRHGPHREFEGAFGHEVLVEEETFLNGRLDGESRAFYLDGTLRELRHYVDGQLNGSRIAYDPRGAERWRIEYLNGRIVSAEGDLFVAGHACPEGSVPTLSADGLVELCARRYLHLQERNGAFVERDAEGRVVQSGRYERNVKVEIWQAPPGIDLPPEVPLEVLVAEIQLLLGGRPYRALRSADAVEPEDPEKSGRPLLPHSIWFLDAVTKLPRRAHTEIDEGILRVYGLPSGNFHLLLVIDTDLSNTLMRPGDLTARKEFEVRFGEVVQVEAALLHTLHLIEPLDNDDDLPGWAYPCTKTTAVQSGPVHFSWLPPAGEELAEMQYDYRLTRWPCDPSGQVEVVAVGSTQKTSREFTLPPSRPGEFYQWELIAQRHGVPVAELMAYGEHGRGPSLRFRVE